MSDDYLTWKSVKDGLPKEKGEYAVIAYNCVQECYFDGVDFVSYGHKLKAEFWIPIKNDEG